MHIVLAKWLIMHKIANEVEEEKRLFWGKRKKEQQKTENQLH